MPTTDSFQRPEDLSRAESEPVGRRPLIDVQVTSSPTPGGPPGDSAPRPITLRRRRRFIEPALLVAGISTAIMAVQIIDDRSVSLRRPAAPSPVGMSAAPAVPDIQPRLIAPAIAAPGEWIVVLAFKNAGLCGQAELRFDGSPLHHRLTGNAGSRLPNWVEMFLAVQVPRSATTGMHTVDLYGSAANLCNEVGKHQAKLATTTIIVGPRRA